MFLWFLWRTLWFILAIFHEFIVYVFGIKTVLFSVKSRSPFAVWAWRKHILAFRMVKSTLQCVTVNYLWFLIYKYSSATFFCQFLLLPLLNAQLSAIRMSPVVLPPIYLRFHLRLGEVARGILECWVIHFHDLRKDLVLCLEP